MADFCFILCGLLPANASRSGEAVGSAIFVVKFNNKLRPRGYTVSSRQTGMSAIGGLNEAYLKRDN